MGLDFSGPNHHLPQPVCRAVTLRGNFEVRLEALWHPVGSFVPPLVKHCYDVTPRYSPWMDCKMKWEMWGLLERYGTLNTSLEIRFLERLYYHI